MTRIPSAVTTVIALCACVALTPVPAEGSGDCAVTLTISAGGQVVAEWTDGLGPWDVSLVAGVEYTFSVSCSCLPHAKWLTGDWDAQWSASGTDIVARSYVFPVWQAGYTREARGECLATLGFSAGSFLVVAPPDLDVDGVAEADEESVGAWLLRTRDDATAPRRRIVLHKPVPDAWEGHVVLTRSSQRLAVFDASVGGTAVSFDGTANRFHTSALPLELWVEGRECSSEPRDVRLTLGLDGEPGTDDAVAFTVIESDLDLDSDNDDATAPPDRTDGEDAIEDLASDPVHPGKYLLLNHDDGDGDGVPDFADGFDLDGLPGTADDCTAGEAFVPVVLQLPEFLDTAGLSVAVSYPASDPAAVTSGGTPPTYALPSGGALRLWLKNGGVARQSASVGHPDQAGDYIPPGTFDASLLGFSDSTRTVTLYAEAVRPEAVGASVRIAVEVRRGGIAAQWGPVGIDAVRCRVVQMDFVVPDRHSEATGLPASDAVPAAVSRLVASRGAPVVVLDEVTAADVTVSGGTATVAVSGTVWDPIADNVPRGTMASGKADIECVQVGVNGSTDGIQAPVTALADGEASPFRRHPYKGRFGPVNVAIPATSATHTIRAETAANSAGQQGNDCIEITLAPQDVPAAASASAVALANIYFDQLPAPDVADAIQYYYGDRLPTAADPTLAEATGEEASFVFAGAVEDVATTIAVTGLAALTPEADVFGATIVHTWPLGSTMRFAATFTETGPETGLFRAVVDFGRPPTYLCENIFLEQAPTAEAQDTLSFFLGEREVEETDLHFREAGGQEASLIFHGAWLDELAWVVIHSLPAFTPEPDTLVAEVVLSPGTDDEARWQATYTETGPTTGLFRALRVVEAGPAGGESAVTAHYQWVLDADLDPDQPDTVRFFIGSEAPADGGVELTESGPATARFEATLADGAYVAIELLEFGGLTAAADAATAKVTLAEPGEIPMSFEAAFTETGPQTRTFCHTEPGDPPLRVQFPCVETVVNVGAVAPPQVQPVCVRVRGLADTAGVGVRLFGSELFDLCPQEDGSALLAFGDAVAVGSLVHGEEGYAFVYWNGSAQAVRAVPLGHMPAAHPAELEWGGVPVGLQSLRNARVAFVGDDGLDTDSLNPVPIAVLLEYLDGEDYLPPQAFARVAAHGMGADVRLTVSSGDLPADGFELLPPGATPTRARHAELVDLGGYAETTKTACIYQPDDDHGQLSDAQWWALADRGILAVHNKGAIISAGGGGIRKTVHLFESHHLFNRFWDNAHYGSFWREVFGPDFDADDFCVRIPTRVHKQISGAITSRWKGFIDGQRAGLAAGRTTARRMQQLTMEKMLDIADEFDLDVSQVRRYVSRQKQGSTIGKLFHYAQKAGKIDLGSPAGKGAKWKVLLGKAARGLGKTVKQVLSISGYVFTAYYLINFAADPAQACADEFGISKETFIGWTQGRVVASLPSWLAPGEYVDSAQVSDGSIFTVGECYWTTKQDPRTKLHFRDKHLEAIRIRTTGTVGTVDITMDDHSAKGLTLEVPRSTRPVDLNDD